MINIISTGSGGNAVLYNEQILVDCGVSFSKLKPFLKEIKIVLLTHCHQDHFNLKTLQKLQQERPTLRVGCGKWLLKELHGIKNIDVLEVGSLYHYGLFKVSPVKLYHDVENCGYRLFFNDEKKQNPFRVFHATDTAHLEGISAKGYDLYALEHNYCQEKIALAKEISYQQGTFTHAFGSEKTHLSKQQAQKFFSENAHPNSILVELHQSKTFY